MSVNYIRTGSRSVLNLPQGRSAFLSVNKIKRDQDKGYISIYVYRLSTLFIYCENTTFDNIRSLIRFQIPFLYTVANVVCCYLVNTHA